VLSAELHVHFQGGRGTADPGLGPLTTSSSPAYDTACRMLLICAYTLRQQCTALISFFMRSNQGKLHPVGAALAFGLDVIILSRQFGKQRAASKQRHDGF